jgi:hypothetical protein
VALSVVNDPIQHRWGHQRPVQHRHWARRRRGIGFVLQQYINLLQWRQAATALWMIALVVVLLDYASAVMRQRIV